jgi:S-layer homology domain
MSCPATRAAAAALGLALSAVLLAQDDAAVPRSGFGGDLQLLTLSHVAFTPHNSTQTYLSFCCANDAYRRPTAGSSQFFAPLDAGQIPNGALIERIDFFVRDVDPDLNAEVGVYLCRHWVSEDGLDFNGDCSMQTATSGVPGDTVLSLTPNHTVRYDDFDGVGSPEFVSYVLVAQFGINNTPNYTSNMRLRGARILYRRQVSPAPSSATFSDVPVAHPFFQFVEALAASGITAGCGTGIYCPDSPLTRGQMAVFLAKALGLHWPAETP